MRKGPGSVYDKWNISVVIWTQIFHNGKSNHGGDRKIFEVIMMTSTLPKVEVSRFKASNHALTLAPIILTPTQKWTNWKISVNMIKLPQQNWFAKLEIWIC